MGKLKEPPFQDLPNPQNKFWSQSWFEWLRDVWSKTNERVALIGTWTANHFVKINSSGDFEDSGKSVPTGDVVGTSDSQTLTNKTVDTLIVTNDPTADTHAANKKYVDDAIVADWQDEIDYWEDYIEGYVLGYYDSNIKDWIEGYHNMSLEEHQAFKVGDIMMNTDGVNPAVKLGYGTWTLQGVGDLTLT